MRDGFQGEVRPSGWWVLTVSLRDDVALGNRGRRIKEGNARLGSRMSDVSDWMGILRCGGRDQAEALGPEGQDVVLAW